MQDLKSMIASRPSAHVLLTKQLETLMSCLQACKLLTHHVPLSWDLQQACHIEMTSRETLQEVYRSLQIKDATKLLDFFLMTSKFDRAVRERLFESHAATIRSQDHRTMVRWLDTGTALEKSFQPKAGHFGRDKFVNNTLCA